MAEAAAVQAWLAGVSGLTNDIAAASNDLFSKHAIDEAFLDFLTSDSGSQILAAWRSGKAHDTVEEVLKEEVGADPGPAVDGRLKTQRRQKITTSERKSSMHYFADAGSMQAAPQKTPPAKLGTRISVFGVQPAACSGRSRSGSSCSTRPPPTDSGCSSAGGGDRPGRADSGGSAWASAPQTLVKPDPHAHAGYPGGSGAAQAPGKSPDKAKARHRPEAGPPTPLQRAAPVAKSEGQQAEGFLKFFSLEKGFGFIKSDVVHQDIYTRGSDLPEGSVDIGRRVRFELETTSLGKPQARRVEWLPAERFVGCLKTLGDKWGFINCPAALAIYRFDVFITREQIPAEVVDNRQTISFVITQNEQGKPQAKDVLCEANLDDDDDDDEGPEVAAQELERASIVGRANRW